MSSRPLRTAYELRDMIVEQAKAFLGSWPSGMTLFIFSDAYGWDASISRPNSEAGNFYRTRTLDLIETLRKTYDLNIRRMSDDFSNLEFYSPARDLGDPSLSRNSTVAKSQQRDSRQVKTPKKEKIKVIRRRRLQRRSAAEPSILQNPRPPLRRE